MAQRQIAYVRRTVEHFYTNYGEDASDYYVYYQGKQVERITPAGRFDNLYRVRFGRNDSTVVFATATVEIGI